MLVTVGLYTLLIEQTAVFTGDSFRQRNVWKTIIASVLPTNKPNEFHRGFGFATQTKVKSLGRFSNQRHNSIRRMSNLKVTFTSRESPKKGGRPEPKIAQLLREDASTSRTVLASSFKGPCSTHSAGCEDNRAKPLQYEKGMFVVQNASVSDAVRVFSVRHWRKWCFSDDHSDNANGLFHVWQRSTPATWVLDGTFGCASRGPSLFTDMTSGHVHGVRNKTYGN